MAMKKKGFTLFEALLATLVITIVGTGIAGVYGAETALMIRTSHRLQAINYARSAAEFLLKEDFWQSAYLSVGAHTANTDPDICALPDCYFKNNLNGAMQYNIDETQVGFRALPGRRAEITVEWEEKFPRKEKIKETLFVLLISN